MDNEFITKLIDDLRKRRKEIDAEKAAITSALRVLEDRKRRSRRRDLRSALLESLAASPGSRASLLALEFAVSTTDVLALLLDLERAGEVVRSGLGWQLAPRESA
jgi:hypothetical protein